jgi:hypothetical protein
MKTIEIDEKVERHFRICTTMTTIIVGIRNSILVLDSSNGFKIHESLKGTDPQSISFDPLNPDRVYCGTFGNGLWKTDNGGQTCTNIGKDIISSPYVMSVAVSSLNPNTNITQGPSTTNPAADSAIIEYVATFLNVTVDTGEEYKACVLSVKDLEMICTTGNNSPASRPEFVDLSLNATSDIEQLSTEDSDSGDEDSEEDGDNGDLSPGFAPTGGS